MVDIEKFWSNVSKFCIKDYDENGACNNVIPYKVIHYLFRPRGYLNKHVLSILQNS